MPSPEKARILVLHLTKYSDHSVVLHAVDAAAGRRSFLVRGLKRSGATAAFHSLALLDVVNLAWNILMSAELFPSGIVSVHSYVVFRSGNVGTADTETTRSGD